MAGIEANREMERETSGDGESSVMRYELDRQLKITDTCDRKHAC